MDHYFEQKRKEESNCKYNSKGSLTNSFGS
jgi:hypothetical protein